MAKKMKSSQMGRSRNGSCEIRECPEDRETAAIELKLEPFPKNPLIPSLLKMTCSASFSR
ncbi:MAG: hypothetical protein J5791_07900 [Fibrobacter sp.]|nr:hypothetical protein [Fibrobacter sp.]